MIDIEMVQESLEQQKSGYFAIAGYKAKKCMYVCGVGPDPDKDTLLPSEHKYSREQSRVFVENMVDALDATTLRQLASKIDVDLLGLGDGVITTGIKRYYGIESSYRYAAAYSYMNVTKDNLLTAVYYATCATACSKKSPVLNRDNLLLMAEKSNVAYVPVLGKLLNGKTPDDMEGFVKKF